MSNIPNSFYAIHDPQLNSEFKASYEKLGAKWLGVPCAFAAATLLVFYFIDTFSGRQPWVGGVQNLRLILAALFISFNVFIVLHKDYTHRNYSMLMNVISLIGIQAGAYISYHGHKDEDVLALLWSNDMTQSIVIVLVFGFSRLPVLNSAALAVSAIITCTLYLSLGSTAPVAELIRMNVHLALIISCLYLLRQTVESRERQLFMMARENLERNIYAKELESAKREADEANEAKSRFLANMSHEVRTPMNGVLQILEVIGKDATEENWLLIQKGRNAGQALMRILNSILDYTKLAHGPGQLAPTVVGVPDVCATVIDLHAPAAAAKGISLQSRLDLVPQAAYVIVDEVKLFEVVNNLVSNAIKFTSSGLVELFVQLVPAQGRNLPHASLNIRVRDTGPGIPNDLQSKVFLPFFQAVNGSTRMTGGTGLGLSIVKELVDLLGGSIELSSSEGLGTLIRVSLPVQVADPQSAVEKPVQVTELKSSRSAREVSNGSERSSSRVVSLLPRAAKNSLLSGRVLLIEDNELNSMLASRMLERFGLEVTVADDGAIGVDEASKHDFDVILMDCQMPVMDGFEATVQIRLREKALGTNPVPIIALTANALSGDREKCLDTGMSDYLRKPYTEPELHSVLVLWLNRQAIQSSKFDEDNLG